MQQIRFMYLAWLDAREGPEATVQCLKADSSEARYF